MRVQTNKDTANVLMLDNDALPRECPANALQPKEFARFLILSAPLRGKELILTTPRSHGRWVLGSSRDADFVLADPGLLPAHLYIEVLGGEWLVTCHQDCWGFHVNQEPVETVVIEHGDRLKVGRFELLFVGGKPVPELEDSKENPRSWLRWFRRAS